MWPLSGSPESWETAFVIMPLQLDAFDRRAVRPNRPTNLIRLLQEFAGHMDRMVARPCCSGLNPAVPVLVDHVPNHQQRPDPWSLATSHHDPISLTAATRIAHWHRRTSIWRPPLQPAPPLGLSRCLVSPASDPPARSTLGYQNKGPATAPRTSVPAEQTGLRPRVAPRIRLQVMLSATILQRCSSSPKKRLRRSAPLSIRVGNSPPRSSCAGVFPALPTPRRRGNVPGRSPDGSHCPCRPVRRRDCAGDHARTDVGVVARSVSFQSFSPSGGRITSNRTPASVAILCSLAA